MSRPRQPSRPRRWPGPRRPRRREMRLGDTCWWDASLNLVSGCKAKGPGCRNCYAAKQIATLHQKAGPKQAIVPLYDGVVDHVNGHFNGKTKVLPPWHEDWNRAL